MANNDGAAGRLLPAEGEVRVRLYGQGLGDCFLLAFPRPDRPNDPCYVVIDCGVGMNTPNEKDRMVKVVGDIQAATGGTVDVLAVTHEHYDHVIGFQHAETQWKAMTVKAVWVPWTEIKGDPDAETLGGLKQAFARATVNALGQALQIGADAETVSALRTEASFLGVDASEALSPAAFAAGVGRITASFDIAKGLCAKEALAYCEPGDVFGVPGTGVRAFVLGPPRFKTPDGTPINKDKTPLVKLLADDEEMYHYADYGMMADGAGGAGGQQRVALEDDAGRDAFMQGLMGAQGALSDDEFNRSCPFDASLRLDWDEALLEPFFWDHYTSRDSWRRVDGDWLGGAGDFALRAGDLVNNISLVLAFELPGTRKVLLFVGDAQVGNWLSWDFIGAWKDRGGAGALPPGKPDMDDLLRRVSFYKVGHHGSHNATVKRRGLERMAKTADGKDAGLTAFIPVSVPVAHDILGYCPMPFYPVLRALQDKTGGRVFLANGGLLQPVPPGAEEARLWEGMTRAADTLPPKVSRDGAEMEGAVPLYLEFTMKDS